MPVFEIRTTAGVYQAVVERELLFRVRDYLPPQHGKVFAVSEAPIWERYGRFLEGIAEHALLLPGGEPEKRLSQIEALAEQMIDSGADRTSLIIAMGGGIVNDMGGFLAAVFMRGIPVLQIPTTLLAQVDAAVGGKTGVNLKRGKNLLGSFHQPHAVLIDPAVLSTLPDREYRAGLWEVVKCATIGNPSLFEFLRDRRDSILARGAAETDRIIAESVQWKAEIVSEDERESGRRRILNFGHTIGHAIEAESGYARFLHGETVGMGMKGAVYLALSSGKINAHDAAAILGLIEQYGPLPKADGIAAEAVFARLASDKKAKGGEVHWVIPTAIGSSEIVAGLDRDTVLAAIEQALA